MTVIGVVLLCLKLVQIESTAGKVHYWKCGAQSQAAYHILFKHGQAGNALAADASEALRKLCSVSKDKWIEQADLDINRMFDLQYLAEEIVEKCSLFGAVREATEYVIQIQDQMRRERPQIVWQYEEMRRANIRSDSDRVFTGKPAKCTCKEQYYRWGIDEQLRQKNKKQKVIEADGNCFFHAVSHQLNDKFSSVYGSDQNHIKVREFIMDHIEANPESFIVGTDGYESIDEYIKAKRKNGEWAGHLEAKSISDAYGIPLIVYQANDRPKMFEFDREYFDANECIELAYVDNNHYNSVVIMDQQQVSSSSDYSDMDQMDLDA